MEKVLVISDSHGDNGILLEAQKFAKQEGVTIIHCGDSELSFGDPALAGMVKVCGNCDYDSKFPPATTLTAGGKTIYVTHGHLVGVNLGLSKLITQAKAHGASIACFGHTHMLGVQQIEGVLVLNPGSISFPRGKYAKL